MIPQLTFDEVVERYSDRLRDVAAKAENAWKSLQRVAMSNRQNFPQPNLRHEIRALRTLLRRPGLGTRPVIYDDYSEIEIQEVVRRGIKRIRPANDSGEELRDVVLWLTVLKYANQTGQRVAFISNDNGFGEEDGTLHPDLQKDCARAGVEIAFYRLVGKFVGANALGSEPIGQELLVAFVQADEVRDISTEQLLRWRVAMGAIRSAEVTRFELVHAQRYRVAENSYYVEAHYSGEAGVNVVGQIWDYVQSAQPPGAYAGGAWGLGAAPGTYMMGTPGLAAPPRGTFGPVFQGLPAWNTPVTGSSLLGTPVSREIEAAYVCNFDLKLSLRIANGAREESLEVDSFEAKDFKAAPKS